QTSLTAHADPASGRESRMPHPVLVLLLHGTETTRPGSVVPTRPASAVRVHISPGNERAPSVACHSSSLNALSPLEDSSVLPVAYRDNSADGLDPFVPSVCPASAAPNNPLQLVLPHLGG